MTDSSLRLLLEFDTSAQRDEGQTPVFLHRRDRKFALTCEENGRKFSPRLWLNHVNHFSGKSSSIDRFAKTVQFWRRTNNGFVIFGAIFGVLTMLGLLFYDGGQRINVTVIIAFVGFQLLLSILTTVQSIAGWQPWRALLQRFKRTEESRVTSQLQPFFMAQAAQLGGLCFAFMGLVTLLLMVVLQDLAFGWSTTLETDANSYHWLVTTLATPWAWLWHAAVPEFALVDGTRFFRAGAENNNISPALWGEWWPFVAMLWFTWAFLPRLFLSMLAAVLSKRKARQLLNNHPAMRALQYRMETPLLDTGNEHNDAADLPETNTELDLQPLPSANILLCWAGAGEPDLPTSLKERKSLVAKVGGRMTLAQDKHIIEQVAEQLILDKDKCVIIATRSWEPPTGELEDFIVRATDNWIENTHIILLPLATDGLQEVGKQHVQQWIRFANRIAPKHLAVSVLPIKGDGHILHKELSI